MHRDDKKYFDDGTRRKILSYSEFFQTVLRNLSKNQKNIVIEQIKVKSTSGKLF
jgi:hypothetical protein